MNNERGFTALELLISVVIIGILTTVAIPGIRNISDGQKLKAASRLLASDLRDAQQMAISSEGTVTVTFCLNSGAPDCYTITAPDGWATKVYGPKNIPAEINLTTEFTGNQFTFDKLGKPSQAKTIQLELLSDPAKKAYLEITAGTGRIYQRTNP